MLWMEVSPLLSYHESPNPSSTGPSANNGEKNTSDTTNLETSTNNSRQASLGATEDDIEKFLVGWHRCDLSDKGDQ